MSDRITQKDLAERVENLNRRMAQAGSIHRYEISYRYGYTAIDRIFADGTGMSGIARAGMTKREAGEFLYAMMVALDDASYTS